MGEHFLHSGCLARTLIPPPFIMSTKLVYFPLRGRGDGIRALLHVAGVEFEDEKVTFEEWPSKKAEQPFGQLPVLHDGDDVIAQTHAIERHIARKYGLYGANASEAALIDQAVEIGRDIADAVFKTVTADDFEAAKEKLINETGKNNLANLSKLLAKAGGDGFLVGSKPTLADTSLWHVLNNFYAPLKSANGGKSVLTEDIEAYLARLNAVPAIANFVKNHQANVSLPKFPTLKYLNEPEHFA